jgi:hypothetical protein
MFTNLLKIPEKAPEYEAKRVLCTIQLKEYLLNFFSYQVLFT